MGCTSSAPNMHNSSTTAEKNIQIEEEMGDDQSKDTQEIINRAENDTNKTTVLPSCDTIAEHIDVVRKISSPCLKTERDNQEHRHFSETINKTDSSDTLHNEEEKVPKLGEVVQKVVELFTPDNLNAMQPVVKITEETKKSEEIHDSDNIKESNDLKDNTEHCENEQEKDKEDYSEEAVSPSQSESSHATRWEALADIAAELPPSLTVDPITGQIYAVSK